MKEISGRSQGVHVFTNKNLGVLFGRYNFALNTRFFLDKRAGFDDVLRLRKSVFNAQSKDKKFEERMKEAGLSIKPIELDVAVKGFKSKEGDPETLPIGMSGMLERLTIKDNVKIPRYAEKIVDDDLKAEKSVNLLYRRGYENEYVSQLFSTSNLGVKLERRFVPTRWSITATDDIIGKNLTGSLLDDYDNDLILFEGEYMSNNFFIVLLPGKFEFELIEKYGGSTSTDREGVFGRKKYAADTTGGYYAAKLGVVEYLKRNKIEAKVLVIRIVKPEYRKSLGVWVVREAVRKTVLNKPKRFKDTQELINYTKIYIRDMILKEFPRALSESNMLNNAVKQTSLTQFTTKKRNI